MVLMLKSFVPVRIFLNCNLFLSTIISRSRSFSRSIHSDDEDEKVDKISPFLANGEDSSSRSCGIELVDTETWRISPGLMDVWKEKNSDVYNSCNKTRNEIISVAEDDSDFDEIDDMRVRGNFFYKIERDSKEFEEYSYDFHRRKKSSTGDDQKENDDGKTSKQKEERNETSKKEKPVDNFDVKSKYLIPPNYEMGSLGNEKVVRTPTFNQLTALYHEPFCLDIYVSKRSVRACIVHRATSNVVAVAHSISKDMKFDYSSKRDATTCAAVGGLLAQRALADDIHNVVYTPRRGDKVEGKLQIVLQSVIDNGVSVKVKIKQRKVKRFGRLPQSQRWRGQKKTGHLSCDV